MENNMSATGLTAGVAMGATATTILATIEAVTGVSLPMAVWGGVGGLWAFWYLAPMTLLQRVFSLCIASLFASVTAKPVAMILIGAAAHFFTWWPKPVDHQVVAWPIAVFIGLLCHTVIGKKLIDLATRAADGAVK